MPVHVRTPSSSSSSPPISARVLNAAKSDLLIDFDCEIGRGSYGKVYASKFDGLCVKVIQKKDRPRETVMSPSIVALLKNLHCPNILHYYDYRVDAERIYVVMERLRGPSLHPSFSGDGFSATDLQNVARQMVFALSALHSAKLTHRDIKPDNFRFRDVDCQQLVLLDFGMVGYSDAATTILGTPMYTAPEVFEGSYDEKCDIWGAGCCIYEMVIGNPPFFSSDISKLQALHSDPVLWKDGIIVLGRTSAERRKWSNHLRGLDDLVRAMLIRVPLRPSAAELLLFPCFCDDYLSDGSSHLISCRSTENIMASLMNRSHRVSNLIGLDATKS